MRHIASCVSARLAGSGIGCAMAAAAVSSKRKAIRMWRSMPDIKSLRADRLADAVDELAVEPDLRLQRPRAVRVPGARVELAQQIHGAAHRPHDEPGDRRFLQEETLGPTKEVGEASRLQRGDGEVAVIAAEGPHAWAGNGTARVVIRVPDGLSAPDGDEWGGHGRLRSGVGRELAQ